VLAGSSAFAASACGPRTGAATDSLLVLAQLGPKKKKARRRDQEDVRVYSKLYDLREARQAMATNELGGKAREAMRSRLPLMQLALCVWRGLFTANNPLPRGSCPL
jgi:hypothetical protein